MSQKKDPGVKDVQEPVQRPPGRVRSARSSAVHQVLHRSHALDSAARGHRHRRHSRQKAERQAVRARAAHHRLAKLAPPDRNTPGPRRPGDVGFQVRDQAWSILGRVFGAGFSPHPAFACAARATEVSDLATWFQRQVHRQCAPAASSGEFDDKGCRQTVVNELGDLTEGLCSRGNLFPVCVMHHSGHERERRVSEEDHALDPPPR